MGGIVGGRGDFHALPSHIQATSGFQKAMKAMGTGFYKLPSRSQPTPRMLTLLETISEIARRVFGMKKDPTVGTISKATIEAKHFKKSDAQPIPRSSYDSKTEDSHIHRNVQDANVIALTEGTGTYSGGLNKEGLRHGRGVQKITNSMGTQIYTGTFRNGKLHGLVEVFNKETGAILRGNFTDGKLDGPCVQIVQIPIFGQYTKYCNYVNGNQATEWDSQGKGKAKKGYVAVESELNAI